MTATTSTPHRPSSADPSSPTTPAAGPTFQPRRAAPGFRPALAALHLTRRTIISAYLLFALLGLGSGAVIATISLGIVQIYRGSGVVNFAQGAMAMYVAYVYYDLYENGDYLLPIPGLPNRIHVGNLGVGGSIAVALATAAVLGLLAHLLVFRPLRHAPALAKVVASVGITLVLQAVIVLRFGTNTVSMGAVLPDDTHTITVLGSHLPVNRLYLAGIVIIAAAGLAAVYRHTQFGRATRACAENEKGAALLGYSPDFQASVSWILGSVLAGLGGIVVAPIITLSPMTFPLLVAPALAAALAGRFTSFSIIAAAALALGMAQSVVMKLAIDFSWFPQVGGQEALPFLLIVTIMFLVGRSVPGRAVLLAGDLPFAPKPRHVMPMTLVSTAIVVAVLFGFSGGYRLAVINSLIGALLCLSLVVITGFVGQISMAQIALAGTAGFTLTVFANDWGVPFPIAPLLAAGVSTALGVAVAVPALRIRGINLAVVTFAAAVAVESVYFDNPKYTGGYNGSRIPSPSLFGVDLGISRGADFPRPIFGILALVVLLLAAVGVATLRRSALGRAMLAVRANERAAAASGVNVAATKIIAFAVSAFIAGIAGTLIGYQRGTLSAESFGVFTSLTVLAIAYLAGISSVSGAMIAGVLATGGIGFYVLERAFDIGSYETLIGGLGLVVTAVLNPEGISGGVRQLLNSRRPGRRLDNLLERVRQPHAHN